MDPGCGAVSNVVDMGRRARPQAEFGGRGVHAKHAGASVVCTSKFPFCKLLLES